MKNIATGFGVFMAIVLLMLTSPLWILPVLWYYMGKDYRDGNI